MDRRLALFAGSVLAAAGALGVFGRRHAADQLSPEEPPIVASETDEAEAASEPAFHVGLGWTEGSDMPTILSGPAALPSPFFQPVVPEPTAEERPPAPRALADMLLEIVSGYRIEADKMLHLRLALRDIGDAIDSGLLEEGAAVVDFDGSPGPGLFMSLAISVLATRGYVRVNVSDMEGNLRAPELDVHIAGGEIRVVPDHSARVVDLDERRSEAVVTRAKLQALKDGVQVHPGSADGVLARCRIARNPLAG